MHVRWGILIPLLSAHLIGCGLETKSSECSEKGTGVTQVEGVFALSKVPDYAVAGKPTVYPFTYPTQQTCDDTVTARLERADGTEVPTEWSVQRVDRTRGTAELTPTESGAFLLKLTFEPGDRVASLNVIAVEDRSAAHEELPRWCTEVHRTAAGSLLCDDRVFRGGVQVAQVTSPNHHAVAKNVVWEWQVSDGTLRRYVDDGSGALRMDPALAFSGPCCADPEQLVATEGDVLVLDTELRRYENTEAGLVSRGSSKYGEAHGGVTFFLGDKLLFRKDNLAFLIFQQQTRSEACVFSLEGGQVTLVPWNGPVADQHNGCQLLPGTHVGASDGGVWVYDFSDPASLRFYAPAGAGLVEAASFPLPAPEKMEVGTATGVTPGPPELRHGVERILPRYVGGKLGFELYSPESGYEFRDSDEALVTFITSQGPGSTRVYVR
ncbi:MAG: hypothetical protein ACJ8AT_04425 [Hyalangium sp.]|uniref:hypothetical protein n=1 Tax=Hyalangium sp. TaxID=2028555 RepID=UPI00389A58A1